MRAGSGQEISPAAGGNRTSFPGFMLTGATNSSTPGGGSHEEISHSRRCRRGARLCRRGHRGAGQGRQQRQRQGAHRHARHDALHLRQGQEGHVGLQRRLRRQLAAADGERPARRAAKATARSSAPTATCSGPTRAIRSTPGRTTTSRATSPATASSTARGRSRSRSCRCWATCTGHPLPLWEREPLQRCVRALIGMAGTSPAMTNVATPARSAPSCFPTSASCRRRAPWSP